MTCIYEWGSYYTNPDPGTSLETLEAMETQLGVSFPSALKQGHQVSETASIFKGGRSCDTAVTGPINQGGEVVGFFQNLEPISRMPRQIEGLKNWVDHAFEKEIHDVIPFADHSSGGWVCLNYQNSPTRTNPEIWQFDINGTSFEDCFTKVADNFDHLIEMLVSEDDLVRLGFG